MPELSYIIVSWNTRAMLLRCIASILADPCPVEREIIVVDNASSDGSPEAVAEAWPDVRVVRNRENLGFARANNQGIRLAKGRYLLLVNSDVEVIAPCAGPLHAFMDAHPRVGLAGPLIIGGDGRVQPSHWSFPSLGGQVLDMLALRPAMKALPAGGAGEPLPPREVDVLSGCFWIARRDSVDEVGLLDEGYFFYGEDMDWCRRFRRRGLGVVHYPAARAIHYGGASSSREALRFYLEFEKANLRYWLKYHGRTGGTAYTSLAVAHQAVRLAARGLQSAARRGAGAEARRKLRLNFECLKWLLSLERIRLARDILAQGRGKG